MPDQVLIAELPKGGKGGQNASGKTQAERWSQGNYTKLIMKQFFEIEPEPDTNQTKQFSWLSADGKLHQETRPFGYRKSKNYGFELGAAVGIPYPKGPKRPIAVFRKQSSGSFLYQLLMPNGSGYDAVNNYLQKNYAGPKHHCSRIVVDVVIAQSVWPASLLWK
jgi:hypothetical protein